MAVVAFSVNRGVVSIYLDGVRTFSAGTLTDFFSTRRGNSRSCELRE